MTSRPMSPAEPPKKHPPPIQPNAHPYAIKTTSSALLSRSNSSPHSVHHARHHYIPLSSSRVSTGTRLRHRHTSSLPSVEGQVYDGLCSVPAPLPAPPQTAPALPDSASVPLKRLAGEPKLTHRVRRAETMPSNSTKAITDHYSYDRKLVHTHERESGKQLHSLLPPNPKQWNTNELTTYLEMFLRSGNADRDKPDPQTSLVGIVEYVRTRGLTGRELLRLTDADLARTCLSDVQCAQLLECSRILRADVLRGRICVDSYHSQEVSDNSNDIYHRSMRSSTSFHSVRAASASADDLHLLLDDINDDGAGFPLSPAMTLHRSNSVSDTSAERYRDLARMRLRRRGKVRGLVETWECASASGSERSTSGAESEGETDPELRSALDTKHSPESPSDLSFAPHDEPLHVPPITAPTAALQGASLLTPPPPYTHKCPAPRVMGDEEEEPSMEELLASSSSMPLTGARAWEADIGLGETVKRIPACASPDAGDTVPSIMESDTSLLPKDYYQQTRGNPVLSRGPGVRQSTESRGKNAKTQKRVVTAIFTGPSADVAHSVSLHDYTGDANAVVRRDAAANSDLQNDTDGALRMLEESISVTRAQMDAFRLRLEEVEADTARQEAILMQAQSSDSCHISEFELRQRRSEMKSQAGVETPESPRDETLVGNASSSDMLESWETMSLADIARALVAKAMGWVFPYGHLGARIPRNHRVFRPCSGSRPEANDEHSPMERNNRLSLARTSCSIILVSFALCAAVLRRMGLGGWVRRP